MEEIKKDLEYYMSLPYTITVTPHNDESGFYYVGSVLELDGCHSDAETKEELLEGMAIAMRGWLESCLENNIPIPEPKTADDFSGKFTLRLPKSLHQKLTLAAEKEGVSLNQYALYKLSN